MRAIDKLTKSVNKTLTLLENCPVKVKDTWYNRMTGKMEIRLDCTVDYFTRYITEPTIVSYPDFTEYGAIINHVWVYVKEETK